MRDEFRGDALVFAPEGLRIHTTPQSGQGRKYLMPRRALW
jgi:hypothetical protein